MLRPTVEEIAALDSLDDWTVMATDDTVAVIDWIRQCERFAQDQKRSKGHFEASLQLHPDFEIGAVVASCRLEEMKLIVVVAAAVGGDVAAAEV